MSWLWLKGRHGLRLVYGPHGKLDWAEAGVGRSLRRAVEHLFAQFAPPPWERIAQSAWLREQHRKRAWGADAWRFDVTRRQKGRAAVKQHYDAHKGDAAWLAAQAKKCREYRKRRAADPMRAAKAKAKRKEAYDREWAAVKANPERYAKKLEWTRAWRERQKERAA